MDDLLKEMGQIELGKEDWRGKKGNGELKGRDQRHEEVLDVKHLSVNKLESSTI